MLPIFLSGPTKNLAGWLLSDTSIRSKRRLNQTDAGHYGPHKELSRTAYLRLTKLMVRMLERPEILKTDVPLRLQGQECYAGWARYRERHLRFVQTPLQNRKSSPRRAMAWYSLCLMGLSRRCSIAATAS